MKISILTLGCRTNQAESLAIEKEALDKGNILVPLSESPDLCIINTCSVTTKADYQSRQLINRAIKNGAKVIVTGCYAHLNKEYLSKNPAITVLSNQDKVLVKKYLSNTLNSPTNYLSRARPIIKVQEGCNNNCSYCAIPIARGRAQSIPIKLIIKDILDYEDNDFNEVVLTGTNIGQYGLDLSPKRTLNWLLTEILSKTKVSRIRISSIEVNYIDKEFIKLLNEKRLCRHLHIPLQSGDNKVLMAMKRPYLREDFYEKISIIKELYPDFSIGSDIIVGFPNEGMEEFESSYSFIEHAPLSYFHVFIYSKRAHTVAAKMTCKSDTEDIKKRSSELIGLSNYKRDRFISSQIGKPTDLIVENRYPDRFEGTTNNYIKASISPVHGVEEKNLIDIILTGCKGPKAYGEPIETIEVCRI